MCNNAPAEAGALLQPGMVWRAALADWPKAWLQHQTLQWPEANPLCQTLPQAADAKYLCIISVN